MNKKMKKGIFWGGIIASMILVLNVFNYLFGGFNALAAGPHGHGPRGMGPHGDYGHQQVMGYHHNGFSWIWFLLFIILGIAVLFLVMKWFRKKSKANAMQQFIDTSLSSHRPLTNQNANFIDQWEKNLEINKKENM